MLMSKSLTTMMLMLHHLQSTIAFSHPGSLIISVVTWLLMIHNPANGLVGVSGIAPLANVQLTGIVKACHGMCTF